MKNKPTFRMDQIAHSHRRSIDIESSKIKQIYIDTWLVYINIGGGEGFPPPLFIRSVTDFN